MDLRTSVPLVFLGSSRRQVGISINDMQILVYGCGVELREG